MALDRLLREEEALADLAVREPVADELENLDLAHGRLLRGVAWGRREGDDLAGLATTAGGRLVEATSVVLVPAQDLFTLSGVHGARIGAGRTAL